MGNLFPITKTATIATGQTASNVVDLEGYTLVGLEIGSAFDGTALSVKGSAFDSATPVVITDTGGNAMEITGVAASELVAINPTAMLAVRYLQLVAGTSQTGATTITCVCREMR